MSKTAPIANTSAEIGQRAPMKAEKRTASRRARAVSAVELADIATDPSRDLCGACDTEDEIDEKECSCCGRILALDQFYVRASGRGGVTAQCKECSRHKGRKYARTDAGKASRARAVNKYAASEHGKATIAAARAKRSQNPYARVHSARTMAARATKG